VKKTLSFMTLIAAALLVSSLYAQDAKLIAAAKNEGKAVVYGSLETESADAIFKVFRQKTGIELDYWRASSTKAMDRALSEYRAGRPLFDAVLTNDNPMQIMLKEGIFAKYDSPSAKEFTKESIDPGLGPRYRNVVIGILYNKSMIKPADAPKSKICSSPSFATRSPCPIRHNIRPRRNGSPAWKNCWAEKRPINTFAIWPP
jgi:spermidine/putrescine-binding protein